MKAWWGSRTGREQLLLAVLGGLTAVIVVLFGIITPLLQARDNAERSYVRAITDLQAVERGAAQVKMLGAVAGGRGGDGRSVRAIIGATTSAAGLSISRTEPISNDEVTVWIDAAPAPVLFGWLQQLSVEHSVLVTQSNIQRSERGAVVRANLTLQRR